MSKKQHSLLIAEKLGQFLGAGGSVAVLPPASNPELDSYLRDSARRASLSRHGGSSVRRSRSRWFERGAGTI